MLIDELGSFDRTILVAEWALDHDDGVRLALALALAEPVRAVSAPLALAHLQRDSSPLVRQAATRAAMRLAR
jgi:hypothetical protein